VIVVDGRIVVANKKKAFSFLFCYYTTLGVSDSMEEVELEEDGNGGL
jgi:hypothetical protein